jgi:UDP-N-acetylmuramoyl-L-alanyl-D-glutamate--2,6-diaminopimelate ligase
MTLPLPSWHGPIAGITQVTSDSRRVTHGAAFLAFPGQTHDGRAFIGDALARGARLVLFDPSRTT